MLVGERKLCSPWGISVDKNGLLLISDLGSNRLIICTQEGKDIVEVSCNDGYPMDAVVDSQGKIVACANLSIQFFEVRYAPSNPSARSLSSLLRACIMVHLTLKEGFLDSALNLILAILGNHRVSKQSDMNK